MQNIKPGVLVYGNPVLNRYSSSVLGTLNDVEPLNPVDELILYMVGAYAGNEFVRSLMWPGPMPQLNLGSINPCDAYQVAKLVVVTWPTTSNLSELRRVRALALEECVGVLDRLQLRLVKHSEAIGMLDRLYEMAISNQLSEEDTAKLAYALVIYELYDRAVRLLERRFNTIIKYPLIVLRILLRGFMNLTPWHRGLILSTGTLNASDWVLTTVRYRDEVCVVAQFKSLEKPYTVSNCPVQVEGGRLVVSGVEPTLSTSPVTVELLMKPRNWGVVFIANNTNSPIRYEPRVKGRCVVKAKDYENQGCGELLLDAGEYASIHFT